MSTTHRLRPRRLTAALTLAAATALALLAGCGSDSSTTARSAPGSAGSVTDFAKFFVGYSADYQPANTPAELAADSVLVVQGRIARIDQGRILGTSAGDPAAAPTIVMVVSVDRVLHGTLPTDAGSNVYVELPAPGGVKADVIDASAPKTSDAVLYLSPAPTRADTPIVNPDAGRPAGQPLYQPVSPQGFVIQAGTKVLQVMEFIEFDGASLRDFVPGAKQFPGLHSASHED